LADSRPHILSVRSVAKRFGGIRAVDDCTINIEAQSIVGLIGPNGAGKTTLFNLISGFYKPDNGEILFKGDRMDNLSSYLIARKGLVRTFQITRALSKMTVLENMMLSPKNQSGEKIWNVWLRGRKVREEEGRNRDKAEELLRLFSLYRLRDEYSGALSGGQKKLLELARALMLDPEMILLDEPFAGVNPTLSLQILEYITEIRNRGVTFLIIEHDMPMITKASEIMCAMSEGKIIALGSPEEVRRHEAVIEAYLGKEK